MGAFFVCAPGKDLGVGCKWSFASQSALEENMSRYLQNLKLNLVSIALALPFVLSYHRNPSPTAFQQAATWLAWACLLWVLPSFSWRAAAKQVRPALQLLAVLALAVLVSLAVLDIPAAYALATLGFLGSASVLVCAGAGLAGSAELTKIFAVFCRGLVLAGMFNAGVSMLQVYQPALLDGVLLGQSVLPGRAVGNLRQPNHLAYLLLWSLLATAMLYQLEQLQRRWALCMSAFLISAIVLSASRTGMLGVLLLAVWAAVDGSMGAKARRVLLLSPLLFLVAWVASVWWAQATGAELAAQSRVAQGLSSPPRWLLIRDAWALISEHPWLGVGWGEFNFAWTLTPMASRSGLHFDHTHNLLLQWTVELGVPVALLLLSLLVRLFWSADKQSKRGVAADPHASFGQIQRAAWAGACLMVVPSFLEYPLWYAYFLFPMAWMVGISLAANRAPMVSSTMSSQLAMPTIFAVTFLIASLWLSSDVRKAQQVFDPMNEGEWAPLQERLTLGRTSIFYPYTAHYMGATRMSPRPEALRDAEFAAHGLIDTWLLQAWANSLHAAGQDEKARYLVQRLLEFKDKRAERMMAPCVDPEVAKTAYQCSLPEPGLSFSDYRKTRF